MHLICLMSVSIAAVAGMAMPAAAQDSVPIVPGGNDALSPYASASQRTRYIVDGAPIQSSWGNPLLLWPISKASREEDPLYRTLILGSGAASQSLIQNASFASRSFSVWSSPGAGVHPTANSPAGTVSISGFDIQFGIAASEFGLSTSSVLSAIVGLDLDEPSRLYVERIVALASRSSGAAAETATLSLGAIDAAGNTAIRADNFGTSPTTSTRILGENLLRISASTRSTSVNSLAAFGGTNFASDSAATTYVISNESVPTNTPSLVGAPASAPFILALDFASRFRAGSTTANVSATTSHLSAEIAGHRGNPTFSPLIGSGGNLGAVAALARQDMPLAKTAAVNIFELLPGSPPAVDPASLRAFVLPSPVTSPAYSTNASGTAEARQYLSQASFRGGNGPVGLGRNAAGDTVAAFIVSDPAAGDTLVAVTDSIEGGEWTIAAYPGMPVLDGPLGASIGTLSSPLHISPPAIDLVGNIYFIADWSPAPMQTETALFKSVPGGPMGHRLELLLSTGQAVAGPNSGRTYTVTQLALLDGDSIASGTLHAQQIIQQQLPGRETSNPESINAFGGVSIHAVITYDNAGSSESYDAVLLLMPGAGGDDCAADFDGNGEVEVPDIFAFLSAWFAQDPSAEFDGVGGITVPDIFAFLSAWFAGC